MVVNISDNELTKVFRAFADATRRDILRRTLISAVSVSALAADYNMSFAAVQKHVAVLEHAGLVVKAPDGRTRLVSADPERIAQAKACLDALEAVWRHRISSLDAVLSQPEE